MTQKPVISLAIAFADQVLSDPAVTALKPAIKAALKKNDAARKRTRYTAWDLQNLTEGWFFAQPMKWPVNADKSLRGQVDGTNPAGFFRPLSPLAARLFERLADSFEAFIAPLRDGSSRATGHLREGETVQLSPAIFTRANTWIDWSTSDIGEFEITDNDDVPVFKPQWLAVSFAILPVRTSRNSRQQPAWDRVELAIKALWPSPKDLTGIGAKVRDEKINAWLKRNGYLSVSSATIKRYLSSA